MESILSVDRYTFQDRSLRDKDKPTVPSSVVNGEKVQASANKPKNREGVPSARNALNPSHDIPYLILIDNQESNTTNPHLHANKEATILAG